MDTGDNKQGGVAELEPTQLRGIIKISKGGNQAPRVARVHGAGALLEDVVNLRPEEDERDHSDPAGRPDVAPDKT